MGVPSTESSFFPSVPDNVTWQFLDTLLIRSTGFPFSLLKQFRFKRTVACFERLWDVKLQLDNQAVAIRQEIQTLVSSGNGASSMPVPFDKIRHKVFRGQPLPAHFLLDKSLSLTSMLEAWNRLLVDYEKLQNESKIIFEEELATMRTRLRELVQRNLLFREAMFLSSVGASEIALASYLASDIRQRNRKTRERERFFINNLQRMCTKNETASFFGPINFGKLTASGPENLAIEFLASGGGKKTSQTEVFFTHWACYELAEMMSRDPSVRPFVIPRQTPFFYLASERAFYYFAENKVYYFGIEEKEVTSVQMKILRLIDSQRRFKEIHGSLPEFTEEEFWRECNLLAEEKIITDVVLISPYSHNGVKDLLQYLALLPPPARNSSWHESLLRLENLRVRFRDASYPDRMLALGEAEGLFERLTGKKARRGTGSFYVDRSIFFEDTLGTITRFELGGNLFRTLASSISRVMTAMALIAIARWECWQRVGREVLQKLSGNEKRVSLAEFWNEFEDVYEDIKRSDRFKAVSHVLETATNCFKEALEPDNSINEKRLFSQLARTLREGGLLNNRNYRLCASPDFLVGSRSMHHLKQGDFTLYLGEMHQHFFPYFYSTASYFCPWGEEYKEELRQVLENLSKPHEFLQMALKREMKLFPGKLRGNTLFFQEQGLGDPDLFPIFLRDLDVTEQNGEVVLQHRKTGITLIFPGHIVQDPAYDFLKIFTFPYVEYVPIFSGKQMPRILWDGLVYQRATWHLMSDDLAGILTPAGFDLFYQSYLLARSLGIPQCVFARHPLEQKPFFIDFENFFLIEMFQHVLHSKPEIWFTEFAPGEDELWLEMDGEKHSCEFRIATYLKV